MRIVKFDESDDASILKRKVYRKRYLPHNTLIYPSTNSGYGVGYGSVYDLDADYLLALIPLSATVTGASTTLVKITRSTGEICGSVNLPISIARDSINRCLATDGTNIFVIGSQPNGANAVQYITLCKVSASTMVFATSYQFPSTVTAGASTVTEVSTSIFLGYCSSVLNVYISNSGTKDVRRLVASNIGVAAATSSAFTVFVSHFSQTYQNGSIYISGSTYKGSISCDKLTGSMSTDYWPGSYMANNMPAINTTGYLRYSIAGANVYAGTYFYSYSDGSQVTHIRKAHSACSFSAPVNFAIKENMAYLSDGNVLDLTTRELTYIPFETQNTCDSTNIFQTTRPFVPAFPSGLSSFISAYDFNIYNVDSEAGISYYTLEDA